MSQFVIAGILLGVGMLLWVVNRLVVGRVAMDPERVGAAPADRK